MKKMNFKKIGEKIIPVGTIAVGFAAAKVVPYAVEKIVKPKTGLTNSMIGGSQILVGILLATMKNKHLANLGLGVAVSGAHTFLADPIAKGLESAGLAGINSAYPGRFKYDPNYSAVACPQAPRKSLV